MMARILRTPDVLARIGVSRSTLYGWIARGAFPASIPLGERLMDEGRSVAIELPPFVGDWCDVLALARDAA